MKEKIRRRHDILRFGMLLHERGFVAATDGNLSVRLDRQSILITPTGISKGATDKERSASKTRNACCIVSSGWRVP